MKDGPSFNLKRVGEALKTFLTVCEEEKVWEETDALVDGQVSVRPTTDHPIVHARHFATEKALNLSNAVADKLRQHWPYYLTLPSQVKPPEKTKELVKKGFEWGATTVDDLVSFFFDEIIKTCPGRSTHLVFVSFPLVLVYRPDVMGKHTYLAYALFYWE